jgi:TolA-binding protein
MDVVEQLYCECSGRAYPNKTALNAHKRTKMHQSWESEREIRELRCRCKRLENEIEALKYDLQMYRQLKLIERPLWPPPGTVIS